MRKTDKAAISALFFFPKFPVYLGVYTHTHTHKKKKTEHGKDNLHLLYIFLNYTSIM